MPDDPSSSTACIVGAGPAGLLLALLLGRAGHRVTVLERSPEIDLVRWAGAPVLQPVSLRVLEREGLLDEVLTGAGFIDRGEVRVPGGDVARYAYDELPDVPVPYALTVPVTVLRGALLRALEERPEIEIRLGATVEELPIGADGRRELVVTDQRGTHRLNPDFIVGCDGKFSAVRELAGIATDVHTYDRGYLDFVVPAPRGWGSRITMNFQDDAYVLSMPYPGERLIVVLITAEERVDAALAGSFSRFAAELTRRAPELADIFTPEVTAPGWEGIPRRQVQHHMVRPERWLDGNVLLIGDSAHAMHAFGGQGLNTSLQDAVLAAEGIGRAVEAGGSTAVLEELLRRRVPFVEGFQETQRRTLAPRPDEPAERDADTLPDFLRMVLGQPELRYLWNGAPAAAPAGTP
ncbi:NAD(P)/FAD-dependent oxidoreductase [Streptomyces lavendofoliae]|uniref:FAD-dependent oxidoreductase n=1 Tax=Streptomyces lavendofoliae TaxID=67314 RepID=UPI00300EC83D